VHALADLAIALLAFVLLVRWTVPPLLIVALCATAGLVQALVA
jgi:chromate transporter